MDLIPIEENQIIGPEQILEKLEFLNQELIFKSTYNKQDYDLEKIKKCIEQFIADDDFDILGCLQNTERKKVEELEGGTTSITDLTQSSHFKDIVFDIEKLRTYCNGITVPSNYNPRYDTSQLLLRITSFLEKIANKVNTQETFTLYFLTRECHVMFFNEIINNILISNSSSSIFTEIVDIKNIETPILITGIPKQIENNDSKIDLYKFLNKINEMIKKISYIWEKIIILQKYKDEKKNEIKNTETLDKVKIFVSEYGIRSSEIQQMAENILSKSREDMEDLVKKGEHKQKSLTKDIMFYSILILSILILTIVMVSSGLEILAAGFLIWLLGGGASIVAIFIALFKFVPTIFETFVNQTDHVGIKKIQESIDKLPAKVEEEKEVLKKRLLEIKDSKNDFTKMMIDNILAQDPSIEQLNLYISSFEKLNKNVGEDFFLKDAEEVLKEESLGKTSLGKTSLGKTSLGGDKEMILFNNVDFRVLLTLLIKLFKIDNESSENENEKNEKNENHQKILEYFIFVFNGIKNLEKPFFTLCVKALKDNKILIISNLLTGGKKRFRRTKHSSRKTKHSSRKTKHSSRKTKHSSRKTKHSSSTKKYKYR